MVPAQQPNTHPRPHLMQKEPTYLLNLFMRGTISGVQNVILCCKIDTVIQLFRWVYNWPVAQGLYKTLDPLFLYQKNLRYRALKICGLYSVFSNKLVTLTVVRVPVTLKKQCRHINKRTSCVTQNDFFFRISFRQNDKRTSDI